MMFRVECKNAARLAATVGLGLTLSLGVAPAFALGPETLNGVASIEGSVTPAAAGVAQIGNETYASFEEAMNAVPDGAKTTIKLLSDCALSKSLTLVKTKEVVLDLNGSTLTVTGSNNSIRVQGSLTICDSSEGESGTISGVGCSKNGVVQTSSSKSAKLTLDGGQIVSDGTYALSLNNLSSFAMNGGTVKAKTPLRLQYTCRAEILGGTLESTEESGNAITLSSGTPAITVGSANSFDEPQIKGAINIASGVSPKGEDVALVGGTIAGVTGKLPEGATLTSYFTSNISAALPDGQYCAQQDGYWVVTDKAPEGSVAVIGGQPFDSLQKAIEFVTDGQATEITLLANTQENISIPEGRNIVLDLGGCQVTSANGLENGKGTITVAENANLTVEGPGVVDTTLNGTAALVNNGTVTINGGTFTRSAEAEGNSHYVIDNQGTMTINGGTVSSNSKISSLVRNAGYAENTLTITGGEFQNDFIAIKNDEYGVLNISGGKITSTFSQSVQNWGEAKLSGGQFLGGPVATWSQSEDSTGDGHSVTGETTITGDAVIYKNVEAHNINGGTAPSVTVTGGTIKGSFAKYEATTGEGGALTSSPVAINDDSSSIVVSGGHFTSAVPEVLLAEGSQLVSNDDGTVTVADKSTVAVVDGKGYDSLEDAIQNASNGSVVVLTGDVEQSSNLSVGEEKDIRLDLAGHDINLDTHILIVQGTLELLDSRAAGPVVSEDYETVTYHGGKIVSSSPDKAVSVQNGGTLTLAGGAVEATAGNGINVVGNQSADEDAAPIASKLVMAGGYVHAREYGIGVYGDGAALEMAGGVVVADDNAAIAGNGTVNATTNNGGTSINVSGGTIIGNITTPGYIACGIYQPQAGTLEVSGGTVVANGGVGILVRAGEATVSGGAEVIATGTDGGAVGDKAVSVPPAAVVVDYGKPASYPGATADDSFSIAGGSFTSEYGDPVVYIEPEPDDDAASDVVVSGGSFSGSPAAEMEKGFVARLEDGVYTVMERKGLGVGTYVVAEGDPEIGPADLAPGCSYVDNGDGTFTIVKPQAPSRGEHAVKVEQAEGGKVSVTPARADEGDKVTITATQDKGQEVKSVAVTTKDGKTVKVAKGDKAGTWTFEMPDGEVTVKVTFGCDGGELCPTHGFGDVDADAWYHDAVDWAVEEGLLSGYADGKLGPDGTLSRAQLATVLWRQAGEPESKGDASFADCDPGAFYAEAVAWADESGIIAGYGDGTNFGPEDPVTREQLATILWRQAGEPEGKGDLSGYPDGDEATDYAVPALEWAVDTGVLSGFGDGTLAPGGVLSRAMLAAMLQRMGE